MNVIPEAIGNYMKASQELRQDFVKLQHKLEIQTKRVENLKKSVDKTVTMETVYDCVETLRIARYRQAIDQELEKQLEEVE